MGKRHLEPNVKEKVSGKDLESSVNYDKDNAGFITCVALGLLGLSVLAAGGGLYNMVVYYANYRDNSPKISRPAENHKTHPYKAHNKVIYP